jgi:acetyl esterase/lipase
MEPTFSDRSPLKSSFDNDSALRGCQPNEKYAVIVHGWLESIKTDWVDDLVENLLRYRGGCIFFMDYSNHSMVQEYFMLVRKFDDISQVLVDKLYHLEGQGFNPDNLFIYGFSFGAQLAINAGNLYGEGKIAEIDGEVDGNC